MIVKNERLTNFSTRLLDMWAKTGERKLFQKQIQMLLCNKKTQKVNVFYVPKQYIGI